MIYIETIKIVGEDFPGSHVLKDVKINCSDVNLLVGEQGCGKSTLLNLLQQNHSDAKLTYNKNVDISKVQSFYFDSEHDNPRMKNPELYTNPSGENIGIGMGGALSARFKSHGEILQKFIIPPLLKAKDCVILLDEPESSLSINNQFKFIEAIKVAVKNNCQLFIATHCYPLIKDFDVISLEHNENMKGSDFIKLFVNDNR